MSMPNFPDISPDITQEKALSMILASIAMEELAFSHILNAEGEKLQYILGTLPSNQNPCTTTADILEINKSVERVLESVLQNQMILSNKMTKVLDILPRIPKPTHPCKKQTSSLLLTLFENDCIWRCQHALHWKCQKACGDFKCSNKCSPLISLNANMHYIFKISLKLKTNKPQCRLVHFSLRMQLGHEETVLFPFYCCIGSNNTFEIIETRILQPQPLAQDFYTISLVLETPELVSIEKGSLHISTSE